MLQKCSELVCFSPSTHKLHPALLPFSPCFQDLASFGTRSTCTQTQCSISTGTATMVQRIRKVGRTTNLLGPRFGRKVANSYMVHSLGGSPYGPSYFLVLMLEMTWIWKALNNHQAGGFMQIHHWESNILSGQSRMRMDETVPPWDKL